MKEEIIFSQKDINKSIIKVLKEANKYVIWFSMLTLFSDNKLNKILYNCKKKKIKLYIFHGNNPFLNEKCKKIYIKNINMHGTIIPNYVNHMRYLSNEKTSLFGGIDYNKILENNYEQHALKVENTSQIYNLNNIIRSAKNLNKLENIIHRLQYNFPIIGNTFNCESAFNFLKDKLRKAKQYILIESQYIQHKELVNILIDSCLKHNIKLTIIYNDYFAINPYHPCKNNKVLSWITNKYLSFETNNILNLIHKSGIQYEFLTYKKSYTHNKIYIIDDIFIIGSFNFHNRSLSKKKDIEIGYTSTSKILINDYKDYIIKQKKLGCFKSEKMLN